MWDFKLAVGPVPEDPTKRAAYLEAKNRMVSYMQRALEGLQIMVDYRWTHMNQITAFFLNIGFFLFLWILWSRSLTHLVTAIGAAILGAFIAPVAKDLVTALQSLKNTKR